jgi:hypothetical protein
MALKMREGYVPPPALSPEEQIRLKIERKREIHVTDDLKRWLMVGNCALPLDRIDRMSTMPGNKLELLLSDGASVTVSVPADLLVENLVRAIATEEISLIPFPAVFHPGRE